MYRLSLIIGILFLFVSVGYAQPSVVGTPSVVEQGSSSSSWSHSHQLNNSSGNTSRRLKIDVTTQSSNTISSVTYGGETANLVDSVSASTVFGWVYEVPETSLANLTEGNSYNVAVTFSAGGEIGATAVTLIKDASQDAFTSNTATGTAPSTSITVSESNELVLDFLCIKGGISPDGTVDGGQTEIYDTTTAWGAVMSSTKVSSSNTTMGWSVSGSPSSGGHIVVAIPPGESARRIILTESMK